MSTTTAAAGGLVSFVLDQRVDPTGISADEDFQDAG
jgi:hypothetical protein